MLNPENLHTLTDRIVPAQIAEVQQLTASMEAAFEAAWKCDVLGNPRLRGVLGHTRELVKTTQPAAAIRALQKAIATFEGYAAATPLQRQQAAAQGTLEIGRNFAQEQLQRDLAVFDAVRASNPTPFSAPSFLAVIRARGCELTLNAAGQILASRPDVLTPADIATIRERKAAISDAIGRPPAASVIA